MNLASIIGTVASVVRNNTGILFVEQAQVLRSTVTKSGSGDSSRAFAAVSGNPTRIPCTITPYRGSMENIRGDQPANTTFVQIIAPADVQGVWVDVQSKDVIVTDARALEPSRTYQIKAVERDSGALLEIIASYAN